MRVRQLGTHFSTSGDFENGVERLNGNIPKVFTETITQSAARVADVFFCIRYR